MAATTKHPLSPPSLEELANVLQLVLERNYSESYISVVDCPDLKSAPYHLASTGLCGDERVADVGGQPNLFPMPLFDKKYSLISLAKEMQMQPSGGQLLGAGAGPFHVIGQNSELAPNLSWKGSFDDIDNKTYVTKCVSSNGNSAVLCDRSPSADCALMVNLYGSVGKPGPVLRITASGRNGSQKSFTECIRSGLYETYGDDRPISMGGVFLIKTGKAYFHVMPDFPPESELPFKSREQVNNWLQFREFEAPIVCLTVFHSADPEKLGLRMEHTHCFSVDGDHERGGHYHNDLDGEAVEYEAYLNTAKVLYRIDRPDDPTKDNL